MKCKKCQGLGTYEGYNGYDHRCDHCDGTGYIENKKKVKKKVKKEAHHDR